MVRLRNICINTLHKGDSIFTYNNNNNNNNNNNKFKNNDMDKYFMDLIDYCEADIGSAGCY
jgi:hypothetical protein